MAEVFAIQSGCRRKACEPVIAGLGGHGPTEVMKDRDSNLETVAAASGIQKHGKVMGLSTGRSNGTSQHVDQAIALTVTAMAAELGNSTLLAVSTGQQIADIYIDVQQPMHSGIKAPTEQRLHQGPKSLSAPVFIKQPFDWIEVSLIVVPGCPQTGILVSQNKAAPGRE